MLRHAAGDNVGGSFQASFLLCPVFLLLLSHIFLVYSRDASGCASSDYIFLLLINTPPLSHSLFGFESVFVGVVRSLFSLLPGFRGCCGSGAEPTATGFPIRWLFRTDYLF